MRRRIRRSATVLVALLIAFGIYRLVAVPWIEPSPRLHAGMAVPRGDDEPYHPLKDLFRPGDWEYERPKILELDRGTLLFDDIERLDGGKQIRLPQCTLVCRLGGPDNGARERFVILRAADGATVHFDSAPDLLRGQFGEVTHGTLQGEVTIESAGRDVGADERLRLETRDVNIKTTSIWTANPVRFQYGPHRGRGENLLLTFSRAKLPDEATGIPAVGPIRSLRLARVHGFEFRVPPGTFSPAAESRATTVTARCDGPFQFDFTTHVASLSDQVDVLHHPHQGTSDQLSCERLEVQFHESADGSAGDLAAQKVTAIGYPAILRSPSRQTTVQAEQLEFHLIEQRIRIADRQQIDLRHGAFELRVPSLEYQLGPRGRLGSLWAAGPGRVTGQLPDGQPFHAEWSSGAQMLPDPDTKGHVLTLKDRALVRLDPVAWLRAEELRVYLSERPAAPKTDQVPVALRAAEPAGTSPGPPPDTVAAAERDVQIDRLWALRRVHVQSPRLTADVREAKLWFDHPGAAAPPATRSAASPALPVLGADTPGKSAEPEHPYYLRADVLHGQLWMSEKPLVERLAVQGDLLFEQRVQGVPQVSMQGDRFLLEEGTTRPRAVLEGRPARVSLHGAQVVGDSIHIHQHENRIQIEGPGSLRVPPRAAPSPDSGPSVIQWHGHMVFDGQAAAFHDRVTVESTRTTGPRRQFHLQGSGSELAVRLNRHVDLQRATSPQDLEAESLQFRGRVVLEGRVTEAGALRAIDTMEVRDLSVHQTTGAIEGAGPGWLVHRGTGALRQSAPGANGLPLPRGAGELEYLRVEFQGRLAGDLHDREVAFEREVRAVYGPIENWDDEISPADRRALRTQDVMLQCDRMVVLQRTGAAVTMLEFKAVGNALVLGQTFVGSGHRLSYAQHKDLLVLEGDGRNDAQLQFQKAPGAPPAELTLRKIQFHPRTRKLSLNDIRSLELFDLRSFQPRR